MPFRTNLLNLPTLKLGSTGTQVAAWQRFLKDLNYAIGSVDHGFGPLTERATRLYQQKNRLPADGLVNAPTYTKALGQGLLHRLPGLTAGQLLTYLNFDDTAIGVLQQSLNVMAQLNPPLVVDGEFSLRSVKALGEAHRQLNTSFHPQLEAQLSNSLKPKLGATDFTTAIETLTEYSRRQRTRLSGAQWVRFFAASDTIADLMSPFRQRVQAFESALRGAGATLHIKNTYCPPERAYLMHYSAQIARSALAAWDVPPMIGVDIEWVHYNDELSDRAAQEMVAAYHLGDRPVALRSRHTQGLAIDWDIAWEGTLVLSDAQGQVFKLGAPQHDQPYAQACAQLWEIGASYGVYKLEHEGLHWSIDGD